MNLSLAALAILVALISFGMVARWFAARKHERAMDDLLIDRVRRGPRHSA